MIKQISVSLVVAFLVVAARPVHATNGYFATGYGTDSKAMAGTGVAVATDTLAPAINPATLVFTPDQVDFGAALFNPNRSYTVTGQPSGFPGTFGLAPGTVDSGSSLFAMPTFGFSRKAGENAVWGLAMFGNGGMNTTYPVPTFGGSNAGVDLSQMFIAPTYARKFGGHHALGASAVFAYQRFAATGLERFAPFSSDSSSLTNNSHQNSFGGGVRVGYAGELSRYLSVGASYQSRIWMSKLTEYQGLFAQGGDFDIPSSWVVGVAVKPTSTLDLLADVQQVRYSEVNSIANAMLPNLMQTPLGTEAGAGFGWDNMTTYKFGAQQRLAHGWTVRGGYSYGTQPIASNDVMFNILAPGVEQQHVSFGLSAPVAKTQRLSLAVTRAFSNTVSGANPLEAPGRQNIALTMNQWDVQFGYAIGFGR